MSWAEVEAREKRRSEWRKSRELPAGEQALPLWERPSMKAFVASMSADEGAAFRVLVDDYRAAAKFVHGRSFVDVKTIRELVKLGWRRSS